MFYGGWKPYVSVAERRKRAEREMTKLRKKGHPVSPVLVQGRTIAKTFWGKAWCDNLESYSDYANRLPRGRTYVRNGSVVDLQVAPGKVTAMVSGTEIYRVAVTVAPLPKTRWGAICTDCSGSIDSMVDLLQGRLSKGVMERVCRQKTGLFPSPGEIQLACSCPDWADMCKHVAAALYGIGARLDLRPEMVFQLRSVDEKELLVAAPMKPPASPKKAKGSTAFADGDLAALFGLDMAEDAPAEAKPTPAPRARRTAKTSAPDAPAKRTATTASQARRKASAAVPVKAAPAKRKAPTTRK